MAAYSIPSAKAVYSTSYEGFVGTDLVADDMNVAKNRFADSRNIMLDGSGYPEKRYGFKALQQVSGKKVHSMKEVEVGGERFLAAHIGDRLYKYDGNKLSEINSYAYAKYSAVVTAPSGTSRIRITVSSDVGSEVPMAVGDIMIVKLPAAVNANTARTALDAAAYFEGSKSITVSGTGHSFTNSVSNGNFSAGLTGFTEIGDGVQICDGFVITGRYTGRYSGIEQLVSGSPGEAYYVSFKARVADTKKKSVRADFFDVSDNHIGKYIFALAVSGLESATVFSDCRSDIFSNKNMLWIISEKGVKVFDGLTIEDASVYGHIPVTSALRNYHTIRYRDNESTSWETQKHIDPGGFVEYVNLLTKKRINTFALNDFMTRHNYNIYIAKSTLYTDAEISELIKVEFLNEDGSWSDVTKYAEVLGNSINFDTEGLRTAPYITEMPIENVRVTFAADIDTDKINGCCFGTFYGEGDDGRLFVSGNEKYPNYEWYSEYNDLTYFPDLNYCVVGSESPIVGYSKIGENLVIFKEKSPDDSAVYMQSSSFTSDGLAYFVLRQCYSEVGAFSKNGITQMGGLPHFVTDEGIFAIVTNSMNSEKSVVNVSYFADPMLKKEALENAALYRYDGLLFCGCGDRCYVFDSKSTPYNVFIWDGIPATLFAEYEGALYFGTSNGRICRFNTDIEDLSRYNDYPVPDGEPRAIVSYFTTKLDSDGSFMSLKTMVKRGCGIMIKPYAQSSVKVYTLTESEHERRILESGAAIFDFSPLYFDVVDFSTRDTARILPFNTKVKKYCALQFKVVNDSLNQGFGVYGIEKRYTVGNFKKY